MVGETIDQAGILAGGVSRDILALVPTDATGPRQALPSLNDLVGAGQD